MGNYDELMTLSDETYSFSGGLFFKYLLDALDSEKLRKLSYVQEYEGRLCYIQGFKSVFAKKKSIHIPYAGNEVRKRYEVIPIYRLRFNNEYDICIAFIADKRTKYVFAVALVLLSAEYSSDLYNGWAVLDYKELSFTFHYDEAMRVALLYGDTTKRRVWEDPRMFIAGDIVQGLDLYLMNLGEEYSHVLEIYSTKKRDYEPKDTEGVSEKHVLLFETVVFGYVSYFRRLSGTLGSLYDTIVRWDFENVQITPGIERVVCKTLFAHLYMGRKHLLSDEDLKKVKEIVEFYRNKLLDMLEACIRWASDITVDDFDFHIEGDLLYIHGKSYNSSDIALLLGSFSNTTYPPFLLFLSDKYKISSDFKAECMKDVLPLLRYISEWSNKAPVKEYITNLFLRAAADLRLDLNDYVFLSLIYILKDMYGDYKKYKGSLLKFFIKFLDEYVDETGAKAIGYIIHQREFWKKLGFRDTDIYFDATDELVESHYMRLPDYIVRSIDPDNNKEYSSYKLFSYLKFTESTRDYYRQVLRLEYILNEK